MGTVGYSHSDVWSESDSVYEAGSYGPGSSTGSPTSTAPGWDFADYTDTTVMAETAVDSVAGVSASAGVNDTTVVTGSGTSGVSIETASGWYTWTGNSILPARNYSFPLTTGAGTAVTLTGPLPPPFGSAPANWMLSPGVGAWTPPSDLTAIAAKLATATPSGAPGGVVTPGVLGETAYGLNLPPLLQGVAGPAQPGGFTAPNTSTPAYGYGLAFGRSVWLGLQGPGMSPLLTANAGQHPWGWLSQFQPALWSKVNQAFTDALARAKSLRDPFTMYASQVFQSAVGRVGATVTGDWGAVLGEVVDFLAGFLNGLTGGLLGHVIGLGEWLTGINLNGFVDTSSSAYAAGGRTAGVALLVLMVAAPGAMPALLAMQALGQG